MKQGWACIVIGGTGSGKSTFIKKMIADDKSAIIYDINNEYYDDSILPDIKTFTTLACEQRNTTIVFEEATIFFNSITQNEKLKDLLVRKRHTGNRIYLVFHSIRSVPPYIFNLVNYVFLFRTADDESLVKSKYSLLLNHLRKLRNGGGYEITLFNGQKTRFVVCKTQ